MATLDETEVHIWYRDTVLLGGNAEKLAGQYLSIEEKTRRDRFRFESDRRDFTIGHDLLRRVLSRYADRPPADWRFVTNEYGKPMLDNEQASIPLSFSLSHTRGCVACAVTRGGSIGIDIEKIGKSQYFQEVADRYFSDDEAAWLRVSPDDLRGIRFIEVWTLKEAFLKALGAGLSGSLAGISFRFDGATCIEFSVPCDIDPNKWHFALFEPLGGVRAGIAVRSAEQPRFLMRHDGGDGRPLAPMRVSLSR
jgi:4'-phosphopantetheinyl transferase